MARFRTASRSKAAKDDEGAAEAARWASFNTDGVNEQEAALLRDRFPKRMRLARLIIASAFATAAAAACVYGLIELVEAVREFRSARQAGWLGVYINMFYSDNVAATRIAELVGVLLATMICAALSAGVFTRVFRLSRKVLVRLYGFPISAGLTTAAAMFSIFTLPYFVLSLWRERLEQPSADMAMFMVVGFVVAVLFGRRAEALASLPQAPEAPEPLRDVGPPDRQPRAVVVATDPLARAAFERLLKNDGFVVVLSTEYADEAREWFRNHGRGADVLLLNDDLSSAAVLIAQLSDEAQSAIGLVRLISETAITKGEGRSDQARGRIVAVEHVTTPTNRAPLIEAAQRAADAARAAREETALRAEVRDQLGNVANA